MWLDNKSTVMVMMAKMELETQGNGGPCLYGHMDMEPACWEYRCLCNYQYIWSPKKGINWLTITQIWSHWWTHIARGRWVLIDQYLHVQHCQGNFLPDASSAHVIGWHIAGVCMCWTKSLQILPRLITFTEEMASAAEEMMDLTVVGKGKCDISRGCKVIWMRTLAPDDSIIRLESLSGEENCRTKASNVGGEVENEMKFWLVEPTQVQQITWYRNSVIAVSRHAWYQHLWGTQAARDNMNDLQCIHRYLQSQVAKKGGPSYTERPMCWSTPLILGHTAQMGQPGQ